MDPNDPNLHRAYACIVCDCFVPSSEPLKTMTRDQLMVHQRRLGIHEYEEYHNITLNPELIKQYHARGSLTCCCPAGQDYWYMAEEKDG